MESESSESLFAFDLFLFWGMEIMHWIGYIQTLKDIDALFRWEPKRDIKVYIYFVKILMNFFFMCYFNSYPMKSILNNLFLVVHRNEKLTVFQNSHQTSSYLKKKMNRKSIFGMKLLIVFYSCKIDTKCALFAFGV